MIAVGAIVAVVAGVFAWREYSRGHQDSAKRKAAAAITAPELLEAFRADEAAATERFVGTSEQVIEVSGVIREMGQEADGRWNVTLETNDDPGIECEFATAVPSDWTAGRQVTLKGVCTGMDDLFGHILMQRCAAVE